MSVENLSSPMKKLICNFFKDDNIKPKDLDIGHVVTVREYLGKIAIHTLRLSTIEFEQSRHPKTIKFHQNVQEKIKVDSEGDDPFSSIGVGIAIEYSDLLVDTEEIFDDIRTYIDKSKFTKRLEEMRLIVNRSSRSRNDCNAKCNYDLFLNLIKK